MVSSIHDLYLLFLWLELFAYLKDYKNNFFNINHTPEVWKTEGILLCDPRPQLKLILAY